MHVRPCRHIALSLRHRGSVDGNHGRQRTDRGLPVPRRRGQRARRGNRQPRRRVQASLGGVEPLVHPVEVTGREPAPAHEHRKQRPSTHNIVRQRDQPIAKDAVLAPSPHVRQAELDEIGGVLMVAAHDRVPNGIAQQPVLREPSAGRGVQLTDAVGIPGRQTGTQRVGEQVVIAVPPPLVVQRDDEQIPALKRLQHPLTVAATGQGIAESARHLIEHRGTEQELADLVRLTPQNLLNEIVKDETMASREGRDEPSDISRPLGRGGMGPGRQRGQLQPRRPPLGARLERCHQRWLQLQTHHLVEKRLRFLGGEPEVRGPHLHELATRTQTGQRQRRISPSGHRQRDLRRQVVQQEGHRFMDRGRVDDVVVIQRHHRRAGEEVEIVDQADQDILGRRGSAGRQQAESLNAHLRIGDLNRGHEVDQKLSEVSVAWVERQPTPPCTATRPPPATAPEAWSCRTQPAPRPAPAAPPRLRPHVADR